MHTLKDILLIAVIIFSFSFWSLEADIIYSGETNNVSVIDTDSNAVIANIETQLPISQLALTPNQLFLYIATGSNVVYVVDTSNNSIIAMFDGFAQASSIVVNDTYAYVGDKGTGILSVIDISTNTIVASLPDVAGYSKMSITEDGKFVYSSTSSLNQVVIIDTESNAIIATIDTITSDKINNFSSGKKAFFLSISGDLYILDTTANEVEAQLFVSSTKWATTTPEGLLYTAGYSTVTVIDNSDNVVTTIDLDDSDANFITCRPDGKFVYAAGYGGISVIDTSSQMVVAYIPTESAAAYMVCSPDNQFLYASLGISSAIAVIDANTNTLLSMIPVQTSPSQLAYLKNNDPPPSPPDTMPDSPIPEPDPNDSDSPLPTSVPLASNFVGRQIKHTFFTQKNLTNILSWDAPSNFTPELYQIYRDAEHRELVGSVSSGQLEFQDHHRTKKQIYTYYLVAVDSSGATRDMGMVQVLPIH